MAVLIEAISVVVRQEAITRKYTGGWSGFRTNAVNRTLCADAELARIGFMSPNDAGVFIKQLEGQGFVFRDTDGAALDLVVVDQQQGPTTPCGWIECFRHEVPGGMILAARFVGSQETNIFCPDGWTFERSLSRQFMFVPGTDPNVHLEFLRHEGGLDIFRDPKTARWCISVARLQATVDVPLR